MTWVHNGSPALDHLSTFPTILAICVGLSLITTIVVILRVITRGHILKAIGTDDYITLLAAICAIVYSGLCIGQTRWGLGLGLANRPKANLNNYSIINFAGRPIYMLGVLSFKVALCFAYLRIMKTTALSTYRAVTWTIMILCIVGHVTGTFILIFQCSPVKKSWRPRTPGRCLPNDITFYGLASVTIFFDIVVFFLPIPLLISLNIDLRRKLALIFVFLLGLLTTVCSVMRMVQIITIAKTGNSTMLVLWGVIELHVGVILTCVPTLGPLFPYFRANSYGATPNKSSGSTSRGLRGEKQNSGQVRHALRYARSSVLSFAMADDKSHFIFSDSTISDTSDERYDGDIDPSQIGRAIIDDDDILKTTDIQVQVDIMPDASLINSSATMRKLSHW